MINTKQILLPLRNYLKEMLEETLKGIAHGKGKSATKFQNSKFAARDHAACFKVFGIDANKKFNRQKFIEVSLADKDYLEKEDCYFGSFAFFYW